MQSGIMIEKNIPLPPAGNERKYFWDKMEVDDSERFSCELAEGALGYFAAIRNKQLSLMQSAKNWGDKQNPRRCFTSRLERGGVRIFRIRCPQ